jgi:hypothetical protein
LQNGDVHNCDVQNCAEQQLSDTDS